MGMFDFIKFEVDCPECGNKLDTFQSKDGPNALLELDFWQVDNFYNSCQQCGTWVDFTLKPKVIKELEEARMKRLTIKDYKMSVGKK